MSDNTNASWQCACGRINTGRFCADCGKEKPAYAEAVPAASASKPVYETYQSKPYTIVGVITGVMILLANSFVCGLTVMALIIAPFAMMLGAWPEEFIGGVFFVAIASSIIEYMGIAVIVMTCISRNKKGKYTPKKIKSQRITTIIMAAISLIASIPCIVWMSDSLREFVVCYGFAGLGLLLVPAMIVLAVKDAKQSEASAQ